MTAEANNDKAHRKPLEIVSRSPELDVVFEGEKLEDGVKKRDDDRRPQQVRIRVQHRLLQRVLAGE